MQKSNFQEFDINLYQLKNEDYNYQYVIDEAFFSKIEQSLIEKGKLNVTVALSKTDQALITNFTINGVIELICDKSLEPFDENISVNDKIIYKFGETDEEVSENLFIIRRDTQKLNLALQIYELVAVNVPFRKIHPKFRTEDESQEIGEVIFKTDNSSSEKEESEIDPRWAELLKLRKN